MRSLPVGVNQQIDEHAGVDALESAMVVRQRRDDIIAEFI